MKKISCLFLSLLFLFGCSTASSHSKSVKSDAGDRITVGKVQREIRIGMPSSQVIEALGSPNIVSTDENRLEVWVYDKMATDVSYSNSDGGVWLILGAVGGSSGAASKTQRTLTIVIKFDEDKKVRDFAYHSSSF
ncbi:outer membrane protein assembly factor BamE [bacterium]|nr:outer membrane protein assembly factor BamE [bacterium]MBU1912868.1 outer membrane protein assembly factor BamE [Candidatus Omnitrophota bacterium]